MNVEYSRFIRATGEIVQWGSTSSEALPAYADETHDVCDGGYDCTTHYVSDAQLKTVSLRPMSPVTLSGMVLSNVQAGAVLHVDGQQYPLTAGDNTLSFGMPGTYHLRVECFPYLDWTGEVTV